MEQAVSLVIPARDAEETIGACLESVAPLLDSGALAEILLVDDGSTDGTPEIARRFPVRVLPGGGRGPGAARNVGWRAATAPLVWFIDADCVSEPDALDRLRTHMDDPRIAGVGGSYGNMYPESWLARLIQEEIAERHRAMPTEVNFLASFNVLYRREVLRAAGGFDERFLKAQDAELAYRLIERGDRLRFEPRSRVRHFHPTRLAPYLVTQARQGQWRVRLYLEHPSRAGGDAYSGLLDHAQPPLALLVFAMVAALPFGFGGPTLAASSVLLLAAQLPMTLRLLRRTHDPGLLAFLPFGVVRALARGLGLAWGALYALMRHPDSPLGASRT